MEDDHLLKGMDDITTWISSVVSLKRISGRRSSTEGKAFCYLPRFPVLSH